MIRALTLLLPALLPSWRFFDTIGPSPRIEVGMLGDGDTAPNRWEEFRPRPDHVPMAAMLRRLFWNPCWNETLYLVTCAERVMEDGSAHAREEILARVHAALLEQRGAGAQFQVRLVTVRREGEALVREEAVRFPVQTLGAP